MLLAVEEHRPALEGTLVRLRAHEPADFTRLNALINEPGVSEGLGLAMPQPVEGFRAFVDGATKEPKSAIFVIERLEDREPVGGCSLFEIETSARPRCSGSGWASSTGTRGLGPTR